MRTIKSFLAILLCFAIICSTGNIASAKEAGDAPNWYINNAKLSHKQISISISGVEAAQDATVVLQSQYDEELKFEYPCSIRNASDTISIVLQEDEYLPSGHYDIYIYDQEGREAAMSRSWTAPSHSGPFASLTGKAFPKRFICTRQDPELPYMTAMVGFEEYEAVKASDGSMIIDYPEQPAGTKVIITCTDGYGCSATSNYTIEDKTAAIPSLSVYKDMLAIKNSLEADSRICAEVGGQIYYSEYGIQTDDYKNTEVIAIRFPEISGEVNKVSVWVESNSLYDSEKREYAISDCALNQCNYEFKAFPGGAEGTVSANGVGQIPKTVTASVGGAEYTSEIDATGNFALKYPEQAEKTVLNFQFKDAHGCTYSETREVQNDLADRGCFLRENSILANRVSKDEIPKGARLVVEINGTVYKSDAASNVNPNQNYVTVTYPNQTPGTPIKAWLEMDNTSKSQVTQAHIYDKQYLVSAEPDVSSVNGMIELKENDDIFNVTSMHVEIDGNRYPCTLKPLGDDPDVRVFQASYPQQKVGSVITVVAEDSDGYIVSKTIPIKNKKPRLTIDKVSSDSKKVTGTTKGKSTVTVTIGKKQYTAKASVNGKFSVNIKSKRRAGTKLSVSVLTPEGYRTSKTVKVSVSYGTVSLKKDIFKTSNSASILVSNGKKGDKIKLTVGSSKYTKELTSNKKKQTVTIKLKRKGTAGSNVKVMLCDQFGKKKDSWQDRVYFGNTIYKGMSAKNAQLTTWGYPVRKNDWGTGMLQWVFESGNTTLYAYVKNGVITFLQKF